MSSEKQTVLMIKVAIKELPAAQMEACDELVKHFHQCIKTAGTPVGMLALALVGAEAQLKESEK